MCKIVDFHSHILPGIDDGSPSVEASIEMLRMEARQGIRHVVATPHFYANHDSPARFLARRNEAEARLREAMEAVPDLPTISIGAEVHFFSGISESDILSELTIDKKSSMLLEMPHTPWTEKMYREMEEIYIRQGITPIIAHVDRYIRPLKTYGIPKRLEALPVLVQANANFFLRTSTRGMALKMLKANRIHLLGSDCHNLTTRQPNLGPAVQRIEQSLGSNWIEQISACQDMILFD